MLRILLTSCTAAGLVFAQWAAMPHGHAGLDGHGSEHAAIPHVHVSTGHHCHDDHEREHNHAEPAAETPSSVAVLTECQDGPEDHDRDAVYLTSSITWTCATPDAGSAQLQLECASSIESVDAACASMVLPHEILRFAASGECLSGRDVCLALRTLRI